MDTNKPKLSLRLFVASNSNDSALALANLEVLFPQGESPGVEIEVVNVELDPARAALDGILVTPTLIKLAPHPYCRVLGNLKNHYSLLELLGVPARQPAEG